MNQHEKEKYHPNFIENILLNASNKKEVSTIIIIIIIVAAAGIVTVRKRSHDRKLNVTST